MDQVYTFAGMILRSYAGWALVFVMLTLIERVFAKEPNPVASRFAGVIFWAIWIPISFATAAGLMALWKAAGIGPLLSIDAVRMLGWAGPFAVAGAIFLSVLVGDFLTYWFHRIQHAWLWRFHAVHHSIRELNAVNSYHHASDAFFNTVIIAIPVSLVTVDYGPTVPVIALLTWLQVVFLHSPTTISFGALRVILADNRFHRIHHSLERQHFDKNFSNIFSFWDRLFGTAYFPQKGEWPAVGLAEIAQPANVREWFDLPLRYRAGSAVTESVEGSPRFQPAMLPGLGERPEPAQ